MLAIAAILTLFGQGKLAILLVPALAMVAGGAWHRWRHSSAVPQPDQGLGQFGQDGDMDQLLDRDALTGLHNRHRFYDLASSVLTGEHNAVLAMVALDCIPLIDDADGRKRRDAMLREFGKRLSGCIRRDDIAARWSNEEYVILYADVTLDEARLAVDRLRNTLARTRIFGSGQRNLTISCGLAPIRSFSEIGEITRHASEELAEARRERLDQLAPTH